MTVFLGCDPGGRHTGLVVRRRDELLAYRVVVREDKLRVPDGGYVALVARACLDLLDRAGSGPRDPDLVVCVEGVAYWNKPATKGKRPPNLTGLLGAAVVLGGILARWSDAIVVPPGSGHGSLHGFAYPVPIRPSGIGSDLLKHCRSGWDASHHGETLWKQREPMR